MSDPTSAPRFTFEYASDNKRAIIFGRGEPRIRLLPGMDANVLDDLIHTLIEARTDLQPLRKTGKPAIGTRAISGAGMDWYVEASGADPGDVTLMVMHPGVGWIALPLSNAAAADLTKQLLQEMPGAPSPYRS